MVLIYCQHKNRDMLFMAAVIFINTVSLILIAIPARANNTGLIVKLCSQTLELDACANCIFADHSRGTDDIPELIHTIIYCMYSQAVYGHNHADGLTNSSLSVPYRQALGICSSRLFAASNILADAITRMEGEDYSGALHNVKQARWSLISCSYAFRRLADAAVPGPLLGDMTLAKRLFDVAYAFFQIVIKVNVPC